MPVSCLQNSLIHSSIGWSNIGDKELETLSDAIRMKKKLRELW